MAEVIISPGVFARESDQSLVRQNPQEVGAALIGPTVKGVPYYPTVVTSYSQYASIFGETFFSSSNYYEYFTSIAARDYFNSGGRSLLITRIISGTSNLSTYASAAVPTVAPFTSSFQLEALAWGDVMNNTSSLTATHALPSGSSNNVRWEITNVNSGSGVFTLAIRSGNDNILQKNYIETWSNLSLDPMLPNYISRVIGDKKPIYSTDGDNNPIVTFTGSFDNVSQYVRVRSVTTPNINSIDNSGNFNSASYGNTLPVAGSGSFGGSFAGGVAATAAVQLMESNITNTNVQGFAAADYVTAINLLANADEYQFNLIIAPGVTLANGAADDLISLCENRGDAIAIVDTQTYGGTVTGATTAAVASTSNYAATYWPWVQVFSSNLGRQVWVPASTVMAGVYAFNDQVGAEWFAPAGLNRGGIPAVIQAERKLTQTNRDTLYQANVNPLASFPGQGVVAYGQKTLQKRSTALDRVNVRRLLINLKRFIGQVAAQLVFEQNTATTRNRFLSQVNPYLESVVQRQGLYAFRVVMDDTNNTPDVIDRNQLVGQIQIQPTKTAEFIILDFNILPTGVSFE